ncbi:MAG: hypothetical protein U0841_05025 [Chloroflexia bacterium]
MATRPATSPCRRSCSTTRSSPRSPARWRTCSGVRDASAVAADARHLDGRAAAVARVARYGDVRGTDQEQVFPIIEGTSWRAW